MNIILPPKRFQTTNHPKYDPIRHRPWFRHLIERREKLPVLEQAARFLLNTECTQRVAAETFEVDERELRDCVAFLGGVSRRTGNLIQDQYILDRAYEDYCRDGAKDHIFHYLTAQAKPFAQKPRHLHELWDVDPTFYPSGYTK